MRKQGRVLSLGSNAFIFFLGLGEHGRGVKSVIKTALQSFHHLQVVKSDKVMSSIKQRSSSAMLPLHESKPPTHRAFVHVVE